MESTPPPAGPPSQPNDPNEPRLPRSVRRSTVEAAPLDPNDPHAPSPGQVTEFLDDLKRFWALNGGWIATTLLVFALVFGGYRFVTGRSAAARETTWADVYPVNSQNLIDLVLEESGHNPTVTALAQLRGGDLALTEHHKLADPTADPDAAEALLQQAESRYRAALESAPHPVFKLNALEGLGVVAESRHDPAAARKHYETLKGIAGDFYPDWIVRTDRRLALLDNLPSEIKFAPDPTPAPSAATDLLPGEDLLANPDGNLAPLPSAIDPVAPADGN